MGDVKCAGMPTPHPVILVHLHTGPQTTQCFDREKQYTRYFRENSNPFSNLSSLNQEELPWKPFTFYHVKHPDHNVDQAVSSTFKVVFSSRTTEQPAPIQKTNVHTHKHFTTVSYNLQRSPSTGKLHIKMHR